jgi:hypothetical protein
MVTKTRTPCRCSVCNDTGFISISFFGKRPAVCTCGAGSPSDGMTLHAVWCDSVVCPFDQLLSKKEQHEVPDGNPRRDPPHD